jgi:hypothetical protein
MSPEERRARIRELDANPFHRALTRKTQNAWRAKHKDELNARARQYYAEHREKFRMKLKAWREANREQLREYHRSWSHRPENIVRLRKKWSERAAKPEIKARRRARYHERMATDPEYRARQAVSKRISYEKRKFGERALRWKIENTWIPIWRQIVAAGMERIEKYRRRC